jgi:pyruvate/2-oxoglutarate dehydrogenase complex dihydrolipoamide dehydrogenase (E3) component
MSSPDDTAMTKSLTADLCVIGAGSAGLSIAAGAAQMGARVVLIEGHRMGGDCLNTGCVPSKSLLASAKVAKIATASGPFGVTVTGVSTDFEAVNGHVKSVIAGIAPHDSVERFTGLGCTVIQARACFTSPREVTAGGTTIRARRFVIATGSRAAIPPIPGLTSVPFFTNETIFDNTVLPDHLVIIGGGPIGCEMAQAHRRLGARVTIIDQGAILPKDDTDAVGVVRTQLLAEGIVLKESTKIARIEGGAGRIAIFMAAPSGEVEVVEGSHLLIAAGRRPNIEDMGLDAAGVATTPRGITVDARLRSTNTRIYAAGDVAGGLQFTHVAGYHAGIIIRNVLFRIPAKAQPAAVPWVTYTDPELAHVGLTQAEAKAAHGPSLRVLRADFSANDRARADAQTAGFLKVMVAKGGRVVGATLVGAHAGELILPWVIAIDQRLKIGAMAAVIAPYPTLSEISKRAAGSYYTPTLFSARTRAIVKFLGAFG